MTIVMTSTQNEIDILIKRLRSAQDFALEVDEHIQNNLLIDGKTMVQWKREFYIKIPSEFNFQTLISVVSDIMEKYQIAAKYRDTHYVPLMVTEQAKSDRYHEEYARARNEHETKHGKPLAAESCKVAASLAVAEYDGATGMQKLVHDFFSRACATLTEMRKCLDIAARGLSGDAWVNRDMVITNGAKR